MKPSRTLAKLDHQSQPELELVEHDDEFYLYQNRQPLFSTRACFPEQSLARIAYMPISRQKQPSLILCGLALGHALQVLLELSPPKSTLTVLEPNADVVAWHRNLLPPEYASRLLDPRLTINTGDIRGNLRQRKKRVDAILIDSDICSDLTSTTAFREILDLLTPKACITIKATRALSLKPVINKLKLHFKVFPVAARSGGKTCTHAIWCISRQRASLPQEQLVDLTR